MSEGKYPSGGPFDIEFEDFTITLSGHPTAEQFDQRSERGSRTLFNPDTACWEPSPDTDGTYRVISETFDALAVGVEGLEDLDDNPVTPDSHPDWKSMLGTLIKRQALDGIDDWTAERVKVLAGGFRVSATVRRGSESFTVSHTLRNPTDAQKSAYDRQIAPVSEGECRIVKSLYSAGADLYDQIVVKSEGYEGDVPPAHKRLVMSAYFVAAMKRLKN